MNTKKIIDTVCRMKNEFQTNDPFIICELAGITVNFQSMGKRSDSCKGFFMRKCGLDFITINSDLVEELQRLVAGHELGHWALNPRNIPLTFSDDVFFDTTNEDEKEANYFAAELLLPDDEVLEAINSDLTYIRAAAILKVPRDFMDLKLRLMSFKGYKLAPPMIALGNCFGDIEMKYKNDYE